jgi:hypothetical protein
VSPAARDWLLFVVVLLAAFLLGGVVFGSMAEILNVCSGNRCAPVERYVVLNVSAGLATATATALVLMLIGRRRRSG